MTVGWQHLKHCPIKDLMESIKESDKNFKEGKYQTLDEVEKRIKDWKISIII